MVPRSPALRHDCSRRLARACPRSARRIATPWSVSAVVGVAVAFCRLVRLPALVVVEPSGGPPAPARLSPERPRPRPCGRRAALAPAAGLLLSPPLAARAQGAPREDDFTLRLPSRAWRVKTEVQQAIRMRREKVFEASEPGAKATVTVTRTPLGAELQETGLRESLMELAGAFDRTKGSGASKEEIVRILTRALDNPAARRERQWMAVSRLPGVEEYQDVGGQRYVRFGYDTEDCTGEISLFTRYDGVPSEDCNGRTLPPRRHYITAIVLPTKYTSMRSNYLDGSTGQRSRFIESLWLLDASAPVAAVEKGLGVDLKSIADSLVVTPPAFQEE